MFKIITIMGWLLSTLLLPAEGFARPTHVSNLPTAQQIQQFEKRVVDMTNSERAKYGLKLLKSWTALASRARKHSTDMAAGRASFSHDGFHERAQEILATSSRIASVGENIAYSYGITDPLTCAVQGWMRSAGHRENILGDYTETGVGIAFSRDGKCFLNQMFARRKPPKPLRH
jgi:uncharacterized protein YkwD